MAPSSAPAPRGFSRRALLASAGLALLAGGCSRASSGTAGEVSTEQAEQLARQVTVQEAVVAAYATAAAADPALGARLTELAGQAGAQLDRLRAAAPGGPSGPAPSPAVAGPPAGSDAGSWLRGQVGAAAAAHAAAAVDQVGPRAALLGSVAAGLRGQEAALA